MNKYLLEVPGKLDDTNSSSVNNEEEAEKGSEGIKKLNRDLSLLRNFQMSQCKTAVQNLDPCIDKYLKNISSLNLFKKELEERMLSYTEELASLEEETKGIITTNENKVATLTRLIKETEDDLKAMLEEKARHERALEAVKEELKNKFDGLKKLEIEKFQDAESIYSYKKLSLLKKIKALDADIEAIDAETNLTQKRLNNLKMTNRELRSKYYKLMKP